MKNELHEYYSKLLVLCISYQIRLKDGRVMRRHVDSVRLRSVIVTNEASENEKDTMGNDQESWQQLIPTNSSTFVTITTSASGSSVPEASPTGPPPPSVTTSSGDVSVAGAPLRRSTRHHPPPDRYGFGKSQTKKEEV